MKTVLKILIIITAMFLIFTFVSNIYATDDIIKGADNFLKKGQNSYLNPGQIKKTSDLIYNVLLAIGSVAVVIVGAILGIQFIMGSVEEKAKIQEALIPFIIGTIIIYGAFGIWKIAVTVFSGIEDGFSMEIPYQEQTGESSTTHESSSRQTHGGKF